MCKLARCKFQHICAECKKHLQNTKCKSHAAVRNQSITPVFGTGKQNKNGVPLRHNVLKCFLKALIHVPPWQIILLQVLLIGLNCIMGDQDVSSHLNILVCFDITLPLSTESYKKILPIRLTEL